MSHQSIFALLHAGKDSSGIENFHYLPAAIPVSSTVKAISLSPWQNSTYMCCYKEKQSVPLEMNVTVL